MFFKLELDAELISRAVAILEFLIAKFENSIKATLVRNNGAMSANTVTFSKLMF